ncbi:hypothetical protein EGW08_010587, partial [Elysia chlorotica]
MEENTEVMSQEKNETAENMETDIETKKRLHEIHTWWEVPAIAHFCSLFKAVFGFCDFDIEDLEDALLTSPALGGSTLAIDIICQLLNGCYARDDIKYFNYDLFLKDIFKQRWTAELGRSNPFNERTFLELPVRLRVEVLHALCDFRLDADDVAEMLKGLSGDSLRVEPLGVDAKGSKYWYFYGTRLYKELPDPQEQGPVPKGRRGRPRKTPLAKKELPDELENAEENEPMEEEEEEDKDVTEKAKRNPVLSANPRQANREELEEEEMANFDFDGDEETKPALDDKEEEDEEDFEDDIQRELAEALYEDENDGAVDDDDEGDADFEVSQKKKTKPKRKSSVKRTPVKENQENHTEPEAPETPEAKEPQYIENVLSSKRKRTYFKGRRKRSKSRSKSADKSKNEATTPKEGDSAEGDTSIEQPKKPYRSRKKKEDLEPVTPRRRSRRRGGNESEEEETSTPVIFGANVSKMELKRLAIDGFHNQLTPTSRGSQNTSRNTSREGSVASDANKAETVNSCSSPAVQPLPASAGTVSEGKNIDCMDVSEEKQKPPVEDSGALATPPVQKKTLQAAVSKLASNSALEKTSVEADSHVECQGEQVPKELGDASPIPMSNRGRKGSSRRKSVPQRRQNKEPQFVSGEDDCLQSHDVSEPLGDDGASGVDEKGNSEQEQAENAVEVPTHLSGE